MPNEEANEGRKKRLARIWLEQAIHSLETMKAARGGFNILAAQRFSDAVRLLRLDDLELRIEGLLKGATLGDLLNGALTSIARTAELDQKPLDRPMLIEIEDAYPLFHASYVGDLLSKWGDHLRPCLDRDYDQAFSKAGSELQTFEVMLAQAILGDLDAVIASVSRLSDAERRRDLMLVAAIELYRRDRFEEADAIQPREPNGALDEWSLFHLALGVSGHVPWPYYPFADY
jgi:hypothetical protein